MYATHFSACTYAGRRSYAPSIRAARKHHSRFIQCEEMWKKNDKITNLNYISARDTTNVKRFRKKNQWRLEPATFLQVTLDWLTRCAINYQLRHVAKRTRKRKTLNYTSIWADNSALTPFYYLTRPQNVLPSKRQIWCYLLKGDIESYHLKWT